MGSRGLPDQGVTVSSGEPEPQPFRRYCVGKVRKKARKKADQGVTVSSGEPEPQPFRRYCMYRANRGFVRVRRYCNRNISARLVRSR
jgi:hypothetical protein